jgi:hypothetical protein
VKKNSSISILILSLAICMVLFLCFSVMAQEPKYSIPDLKTHHIKSKFVDQEFIISVSMPGIQDKETEKFPVLYCLDSNFFYPRDITHLLQAALEVPQFILVGIGYPGKHFLSGYNLRARDMTPVEDTLDMHSIGLVRDVLVPKGKKTGGAKDFLEFIRQELIPIIRSYSARKPPEKGKACGIPIFLIQPAVKSLPNIPDYSGNPPNKFTYKPLSETLENPWKRAPIIKKGSYSTYQQRCICSLLRTLIATVRPSRVSPAFHTSPIPPAPMGARISYGPSLVPGVRVISLLGRSS